MMGCSERLALHWHSQLLLLCVSAEEMAHAMNKKWKLDSDRIVASLSFKKARP